VDEDFSSGNLGPAPAFDDLWRASVGAIQRQCLSLLNGSRADADDAVAMTAMKAFQHYANLRDGVRATTWLLTIARNVCRDFHRGNRRRRLFEVSLDHEHFEIGMTAERSAELFGADVPESDPAEVLEQSIEGLPPRLRRVAQLHLVSRMRYADIARELGMSDANVRKQMQHIRAHLRGGVALARDRQETARADRDRRVVRRVFSFPIISGGVERDELLVLAGFGDGSPAPGVQALERYIRKHARGWRRRLQLARVLAANGRFADAIGHYRWAIGKQPYPLDPWLELAAVLRLLGRSGQALAVYERGEVAAGREGDRHHLRAKALQLRGEIGEALRAFAEAASCDPRAAAHQIAHGQALLAAGRTAEAEEAFERALALDPDDPLAAALSYDARRELGWTEAARERLAAAAERDPSNVALLERLAFARLIDGESAANDSLLQAFERVAPRHAGAAIAMSMQARAAEDVDAAMRPLLAFLELHPRHAMMQLALAFLLASRGDEGAVAAAMRACALDPANRSIRHAAASLLRTATSDRDEIHSAPSPPSSVRP
jgi:RNA polymerase sigma factor (sigma-70 family)